MTFQKFEKLVKAHCPNVYSVSQKAHTQDGGVLVTYSKNGKAYIYKGSYFGILSKLGMKFISIEAVEQYKQRIKNLSEDDGFGLFGLGSPEKHQELADSIKREANSYTGAILVNDSGDDLGVFEGL